MDWNHPSIGCVGKDGKKGSSKSDQQNTGYLATVKRAIDGEQR